ncbi:hypothetical protein [Aquimarina algiphila]|uniref:hypothetical protein n=1 Tax=Aquimarina algiphila TaxID=2047982 RepID=UPI00233096F9|nr:hypothetical protein [Aquimarina algiphila]
MSLTHSSSTVQSLPHLPPFIHKNHETVQEFLDNLQEGHLIAENIAYEAIIKKLTDKNLSKESFIISMVCDTYNLMTIYFDLIPIYNDVFLFNETSRRALVTYGCLFYYTKNNTLKVIPMTDDITTIKNDLSKILNDIGDESSLHFWKGCGMRIPEECSITISFTKVYPNLYIKSKTSDDKIFLEEQPWNVSLVYNGDDGDNESFLDIPNSLNPISHQIVTPNSDMKNTNIPKGNGESNAIKKNSLTVNKEMQDCDMVVELPYMPPTADSLISIGFKNDNTTEIILTTS